MNRLHMHIISFHWFWAMFQWHRKQRVPAFEYRRLLIMVLAQFDEGDRAFIDHLIGPAFLQKMADKERRRRMAVRNCRAAMTNYEQLDAAFRGLCAALDRMAREVGDKGRVGK